MKTMFFPRLAFLGIKKNRRLYVPYLFSCIGMVMMYYILHSLSCSPVIGGIKNGSNVMLVLSLGKFVIAAFSLLFLFYTNSFLIRRRYREFGLYNVLGMDKRGIGRVILWESLFVSGTGLVGGVGFGILLSKLAELGLLNAIHGEIDYRFTVSGEAVGMTALIYGGIFLLLMLKSLISVRKCRPLELLKSENAGEKPPRGNRFFALIGLVILGAAYWIAVSIKSPLTALVIFFVAVVMVIIATYLLFMTGSVALCRILQRRKKYYYKKQHFVSVSSMAYRMKRNGAGLASICILATMVLVMISSTSCLYFGESDMLRAAYPRENSLTVFLPDVDGLSDETVGAVRTRYEDLFRSRNFTPKKVYEYRFATVTGMLNGDRVTVDPDAADPILNYDQVRSFYFLSADDYNRAMGTSLTLADGEAMVYCIRCRYNKDTLDFGNGLRLNVTKKLNDFPEIGHTAIVIMPSIMVVIPDYGVLRPLADLRDTADDPMLACRYFYGYDTDMESDAAIELFSAQEKTLDTLDEIKSEDGGYGYEGGCLDAAKDDFYTTFGGLFFLGIMLSAVFIFAAAMIIYYKQVSEGYEDQKRFAIMQKVGMTKQDIKKSINSQVLTVFFAPLLFAGLHLGFAFPLVWKLLQLFSLTNLSLIIWVTVGAFLCFGLFYALIYKITARAYYNIVSGAKE